MTLMKSDVMSLVKGGTDLSAYITTPERFVHAAMMFTQAHEMAAVSTAFMKVIVNGVPWYPVFDSLKKRNPIFLMFLADARHIDRSFVDAVYACESVLYNENTMNFAFRWFYTLNLDLKPNGTSEMYEVFMEEEEDDSSSDNNSEGSESDSDDEESDEGDMDEEEEDEDEEEEEEEEL